MYACTVDLEPVFEENVYEDGICKFVSQYEEIYSLSTGEPVLVEPLEVESFVPKNDCCLAGILDACEIQVDPIACSSDHQDSGYTFEDSVCRA